LSNGRIPSIRRRSTTWLGLAEDESLDDGDRYSCWEGSKTVLDKDYLGRLEVTYGLGISRREA